MGKLQSFEKPIGFRDLLPNITAKKRWMENQLQGLFHRWGYQEIVTPTLEYDETVGKASAIPSNKTFKLLDRLGHTLVLRPDMTAPIGRVVSSLLKNQDLPYRISYHSNVFRAQEHEAGRAAEFYQSGVELIGEGTPDADAEVLVLAIESLKQVKVGAFRLVIGHTGFLQGVLAEWVTDQEVQTKMREALSEKNMVGYQQLVDEFVDSEKGQKVLQSLLSFQGDGAMLEQALNIAVSYQAKQAIGELVEIWKLLKLYDVETYITFDLTLVPHLDYYTGMVFEGTTERIGFPILSGGRYDTLLKAFDNSLAATGFALHMDRILDVSEVQLPTERRIKVIYDQAHRDQALSYAFKLRREEQIMVETHRIEKNEKEVFKQSLEYPIEIIAFIGEEEA
ncbi:MAG: ATP phosphoribosyltransferase regulatory subunit [Tepidibacillus sp.]